MRQPVLQQWLTEDAICQGRSQMYHGPQNSGANRIAATLLRRWPVPEEVLQQVCCTNAGGFATRNGTLTTGILLQNLGRFATRALRDGRIDDELESEANCAGGD